MKNLAAVIAVVLIAGIGVPACADPTISITQPGHAKAAASAPLTYAVTNSSHRKIALVTSGGCGTSRRLMMPAAHFAAGCAVADGKSTIAASEYLYKSVICTAHITRQGGINYTTFDSTTPRCTSRDSLNHIEIVLAPR